MARQVLVMVQQAEEVGKSRGSAGRERSRSSGEKPPWRLNSWMWSSVELLLKMASTKCTWREMEQRVQVYMEGVLATRVLHVLILLY